MATIYSAQAKKMFAQATAGLYEQAKGSEVRGKVRVMVFDRTEAQVIAQNDICVLGVLPKGYRVLEGFVAFTAHGASVTLDIGTYTRTLANVLTAVSENAFLSAHDVSGAGQTAFANTLALGMLADASTAEHVVAAKYEAANPTDDADLIGWIKYIAPDV